MTKAQDEKDFRIMVDKRFETIQKDCKENKDTLIEMDERWKKQSKDLHKELTSWATNGGGEIIGSIVGKELDKRLPQELNKIKDKSDAKKWQKTIQFVKDHWWKLAIILMLFSQHADIEVLKFVTKLFV